MEGQITADPDASVASAAAPNFSKGAQCADDLAAAAVAAAGGGAAAPAAAYAVAGVAFDALPPAATAAAATAAAACHAAAFAAALAAADATAAVVPPTAACVYQASLVRVASPVMVVFLAKKSHPTLATAEAAGPLGADCWKVMGQVHHRRAS